jgi:predicted acylesterase/phospholipase RssA
MVDARRTVHRREATVPEPLAKTPAAPRAVPRCKKPARVGLALAGGGPLGAFYEIGALCALEEALVGVDFTKLDGYLGVSAGAFIAASLANGITPRAMCAGFIEDDAGRDGDLLDAELLLRPAWGEFARRLSALPGLAAQAGLDLALRRRSKLAALERLGRAVPTGMFSAEALQRQLAAVFSAPGRTNDFRQLGRRLVLVATDLDAGTAAPFGMPGWDHVPISLAVQASAALPGMFPPVSIDGHSYVDGALKKTLHASVLLDDGVDLLLALNPLVPFDGNASRAEPRRALGRRDQTIPRMVDGGLPLVLSQTFRSLIHSRLALGMKGYERSHPNADIVLFEPDNHDSAMFLANTFSVSHRAELAEHAYQRTRDALRSRATACRSTMPCWPIRRGA